MKQPLKPGDVVSTLFYDGRVVIGSVKSIDATGMVQIRQANGSDGGFAPMRAVTLATPEEVTEYHRRRQEKVNEVMDRLGLLHEAEDDVISTANKVIQAVPGWDGEKAENIAPLVREYMAYVKYFPG